MEHFMRTRQISMAVVALMLGCALQSKAQFPAINTLPEKTDTRHGNKQFEKENYTDAEGEYKKALDKKADMPQATFNLGDAVYKQKRFDDAIKQFQQSAQNNPDPLVKSKAFHNLGNSYLEQQKWPEAVNSYKEALRLNANDKDTKYNLAYANAMIVRQKQQEQQKQKDKKDKKDDKKDQKKDQDQQGNDHKKPDSPKDDQQSKNDQQKKDQQKGAQPKLTKEEAEKLLQALMNEEQKTNQKVQQKQVKGNGVKMMKDW